MKSKIVILDDSVLLYENYMGNDEWEKVNAFPRGGLTYLIKNNNIKFFAYIDYFYRNCLASMELPLYIIDETMGIDGEYDDIQEITDILNRIFPSANGDVDLSPYLKRIDADKLYQPIGDYLTKESGDTLYQPLGDYVTDDELEDVLDDYYTKDESDEKYQPTGDYALKSDIPEVPSLDGYATEIWVENQGYINQIKTINNISLIGEGNIQIGSGGTIDAYSKEEADERFQPKGEYVTSATFITYITNLQEQITSIIESISGCCSSSGETIYRWITMTGENDYICSGTSKFTKEKKQQSTDNGMTWTDVSPAEYQRGSLIEVNSSDCGYEPTIEYRWVNVSGGYVCSGTTKYNQEKKQYRVDGGSWIDTNPLETRRGSTVIETQSTDCGYTPVQYRWYQAPATDYVCSGTSKYYKEYYQVSNDGGQTWSNVTPTQTRQGSLIETQSTDCGYIPSPKKITATYINGTVKSLDCDSTGSLTRTNIEINLGNNANIVSATVGDCVTTLGGVVFGSCSAMTSIVLPETITYIDSYAFQNCQSLSSITIPSKVTEIRQGTFLDCSGLTSVTIQSGVTKIGHYAFSNCSGLTNITIEATTPPTLGSAVFMHTNDTFKIYVPAASVNAYKSASGWSDYSSRIQAIS